ncbi:MAG: iron-containing alcohol dehydrogenase [Fibrobacterales bacterium]
MNPFIYENPTKIIFGQDRFDLLPEEIAPYGSRVLLLFGGGSIKQNGLYDTINTLLSKAGCTVVEHGGVQGNARLFHAEAGVQLVREHKLDLILAVGGGSVIDEAKSISAGVQYTGSLWNLYSGKGTVGITIPVIAIQTLPATASEMNGITVLTHDTTLAKRPLVTQGVLNPKVSFLDPSTTFSLSPKQTAYAAADIISHCTEGYFTTTAATLRPLDGIIEGLVHSVISSVADIQKDPSDYDARAAMMWSATMGWNGITQVGIPGMSLPCHALEMPLSGIHDIAHGAGLSMITPHWMRIFGTLYSDRIIQFGERILGLMNPTINQVADGLDLLYNTIGAPLHRSDVGVSEIDIDACSSDAIASLASRGVVGYEKDKVIALYKEL